MLSHNQKFDKLIERVYHLIDVLDNVRYDFAINRNVDKFWYMQKIAELNTLRELNRADIEFVIDNRCMEVYQQWKKDVRWLNAHLKQRATFQKEGGLL